MQADASVPLPRPVGAAPLRRASPDVRRLARRVLLVGVPVAYVGLLVVGPLVAVVHGAFARGAGAFFAAVIAPLSLHALGMTAALTLGAVLLNTAFGLAIAWVLVRDRFAGKRLLGGLVDLPFAVSPVMVGLTAMLLFGRRGMLRPALDAAGVNLLFSWPAMLLATTFVSLPLVVREVVPVLEEVGTAEEEAARTLGASRWQTFVHVVLPNVRWGLFYGVALTTARAIGEFGAVLLVGGAIAGKTETATLAIWRALEQRDETTAYALAVVLAAASVTVLGAMELAKRRRAPSRATSRGASTSFGAWGPEPGGGAPTALPAGRRAAPSEDR